MGKILGSWSGMRKYLEREMLAESLHGRIRYGCTSYPGMDNVELEIQPEALELIAQKALDRQIGARGLRAIMERVMTKIMFIIPSDLTICKVIITPECIEGREPKILRDPQHPRTALGGNR